MVEFQPLIARTWAMYRPVAPVAYDCVRVIAVRDGSAFLHGDLDAHPVNIGDVILLGADVLCGVEPEGRFTATTIYIDTDFAVETVFWRYSDFVKDHLDALAFTNTLYAEPAQILRIGEQNTERLAPWLDELAELSANGQPRAGFLRMQALWFAVLDVIDPFVRVSLVRLSPVQRECTRPGWPRDRRFTPLRPEARTVAAMLRADPARRWTLSELAEAVHLSIRQLGHVFADAYGKTPITYLAMLRVERMAVLLRTTDEPVWKIARQVGWNSRNRAGEAFCRYVGVSPSTYRASPRIVGAGAHLPGDGPVSERQEANHAQRPDGT